MKAMIFAAGLGTRLRPLTDTVPKALVPVGGVPMLERVARKLGKASLGPIVVNVCHLADKVESFDEGRDLGVKILLSREDGLEPLETGGGIKHAARLLDGRFLLHNVDMLSDLDIRQFVSRDDPDSLATLLVNDRPSDRYLLFDDDMRLVGWTNVLTGQVKGPAAGKDISKFRRYAFCGIHIISAEKAFPLMDGWPERFGIMDFYLDACSTQLIRGVVADRLNIIDIGSPETLAEAERAVSQGLFAL